MPTVIRSCNYSMCWNLLFIFFIGTRVCNSFGLIDVMIFLNGRFEMKLQGSSLITSAALLHAISAHCTVHEITVDNRRPWDWGALPGSHFRSPPLPSTPQGRRAGRLLPTRSVGAALMLAPRLAQDAAIVSSVLTSGPGRRSAAAAVTAAGPSAADPHLGRASGADPAPAVTGRVSAVPRRPCHRAVCQCAESRLPSPRPAHTPPDR